MRVDLLVVKTASRVMDSRTGAQIYSAFSAKRHEDQVGGNGHKPQTLVSWNFKHIVHCDNINIYMYSYIVGLSNDPYSLATGGYQ
jgi:hypothetical protein